MPVIYAFGFVAGLLGGAYNTNAPPIVLYGALCRWTPERFRATLQAYFLPAAILVVGGHAVAGLWTRDVFVLYVFTLPFVAVGVVLGRAVQRRIVAESFTRLLYVVLVVCGTLLFL